MLKNINRLLYLFIFLFLQTVYGNRYDLREQAHILENYKTIELYSIIDVIKKDLLSENVLLQDAGCIILLTTLKKLNEGDIKAEFIFTQLSVDNKVLYAAADIIESRLLGWYGRENPDENEDDITLYTPLFQILGKADNKTARGTLVRSFLHLCGRKDILEGIPISEELVGLTIKRLQLLNEKLCCVFPGKDWVVAMLEKDSRSGMLDIFEYFLMANKKPSEKMKKEIKEFITGCLEYGDSKNGHVIRIKAAKIAGVLVQSGDQDLAQKIEDVSKNDPYYVHKYNGKAGYSMTELKYPVREICSKILFR
jgi:hypothetical protein